MTAFVARLFAIGLDPADDEETRLRKPLLVAAALTIAPLAVLWGAIYWFAGAPVSAVIPWTYSAASVVGLVAFSFTHSYRGLAASQFAPYMILPFLLMWTLGGFVDGSAVAVWASLGPIAGLLLGHRRFAVALALVYVVLMVAAAIVPAPTAFTMPDPLRRLLFVLNLSVVPVVALLLVRLFANGREGALRTVRSLVGRYFSREVMAAMVADPRRTELGGEIAQVTVLFADLGSYSSYAETRSPAEVVDLLNRYFGIALPIILEHGGTPTQLAGDAVMAVFGAPHAQPDHALRACRAAAAVIDRTERVAVGPPAGPRFHVGINTGPALVGNIGSDEYRNFTAIGDTTNLAARLQDVAEPGRVVIGPETAAAVAGAFPLDTLGAVKVKGRIEPVEAFALGRLEPARVPA
ncbi:MAG TPA: adenylate/guanylate cyclase domain-containing protein [Candidatus Limnocylindrales bacterium]|nr:adenylate/guanylate cyclase domain-containing protein [Candidatus Limnocylindrales bacterium]